MQAESLSIYSAEAEPSAEHTQTFDIFAASGELRVLLCYNNKFTLQ